MVRHLKLSPPLLAHSLPSLRGLEAQGSTTVKMANRSNTYIFSASVKSIYFLTNRALTNMLGNELSRNTVLLDSYNINMADEEMKKIVQHLKLSELTEIFQRKYNLLVN
jgi:hypothetical protein